MAAPKKKKGNKINLLPREEFASSTLGRILTWLLSTFRIIVIAVEIVVVLAFLSRFWLDARVTDLNDEIKQKQAIIASQTDFEKEFRTAQDKLKVFSELTREEEKTLPLLQTTASHLPFDVSLVSFTVTQKQTEIRGTAFAERSIAQLIANLESTDLFEDITLSQIDSKANSPFISFSLKAQAKNSQEREEN